MHEIMPLLAVESNSLRGCAALLAFHSLFYWECGNPGINRPRLQVACGHGTEAEYCPLANIHSGTNRSARTNPRVGAQAHGEGNEWERRVVVIVRGSANITLLGNDGVRPHGHQRRVINLRLVAQGHPVGAQEIPRSPDPGPGINMAVGPERSPETAQQKSTPGVEGSRRCAKQERAAD
jgi:hypothetical protein